MLQKVDKDRLDKVLATIESAKIKFPNATITKELGVHGGTVSAYLNGIKPMSSNFYRKFMDKYGSTNAIPEIKDHTPLEKLINHNNNLIDAHKDVAIANRATAEANRLSASTTNELAIANKELAEANRELTVMLKNSINSNGQNSHPAEKVLHRIAEQGVPELWATKQEGLDKLNRFLFGTEWAIAELSTQQQTDKSSIS